MNYFILFVILVKIVFSSGEECALINPGDNATLDLTESVVPQDIGTFRKDVSIGDALPGRWKSYDITPKDISSTLGCKSTYFQMNFENQELWFTITDEFLSFDDDVINQNNVKGCDFYLNFEADPGCKLSNSQIDLNYFIQDVNTHNPVFDQSEYNLQITFPIAQGTSLIKLSNDITEIKAVDKDFSTKTIQFQITDEDAKTLFDVIPLGGANHAFSVDLVAKDLLYLQQSITFTLTATDDGTDPGSNSGTTEITISLNEHSVPPSPHFEDPFIQGKVDVESPALDQAINDKPIKLQGTYGAPVFTCSGDAIITSYFKCDQQGDEVNVKLIKVPDEELWSQALVFVLQIEAKIENEVHQTSTNAIPFIITLENVDTSTTTTTETTPTATTPTETTPTETTPTETTPTETTPTETTPTETTPTDSSPGSSSGNPTENTPPDTTTEENNSSTCSDKDPDSDLITVIIILSIVACVLLAALAYGYFKYVRGRKTGEKAPLIDSSLNNNSYDPPDNISDKSDDKESNAKRNSVDSETYSKPLDALPDKDEIQIQNEIDREPKGLDRLIAEQEENNLLKPVEVKSRKRSMTFSESDDESRQYRENLSGPVKTEVINENKPNPVRKKSAVTFKL